MEVLEEKDNKMYNRKEVSVAIKGANGTASRKQAIDDIAGKYGSKELIVIRKIGQRFGDKGVVVEARIYADKKSLEENEPAYFAERGKPKKKEGEQKNG
jgi:ribosomal protein S24E